MTSTPSLPGGPTGSVLVVGVGALEGLGAAIARRFGARAATRC